MTDKTDVMRGEFEAWAVSEGFDVTRDKTIGQYSDFAVESRWVVWKAALQSPAVREMVEALKLAREELDGLPRSLGYDFTHIPKMDKSLANFASIKGDKA